MSWTKNFESIRPLFMRATLVSLVAFALLFAGSNSVNAQSFTEGFDVVAGTPCGAPTGWVAQNNSVPVGSTCWFQGNSAVFPAQAGPVTSYIVSNFNATTGDNTISTWLLTPQRTFNNGDVIKFWTRTITANPFPDRLEVRRSSAGASTNTGTGPTAVGDFTTLLLTINPTLVTNVYPEIWTEFTITLSGLPGPTGGRIAFRYFVTNGGPAGANSNYIGIDTFSYTGSAVVVPGDAPLDMNGDGKTDFVVVRATTTPLSESVAADIYPFTRDGSVRERREYARQHGEPGANALTPPIYWYVAINGSATTSIGQLGDAATDTITPEDFDGDGKDDLAVWTPGAPNVANFKILQSLTNTVRVEVFGQSGDDPAVVGDYDGDNKADPATYRCPPFGGADGQCFFFYRGSLNNPAGNITYVPWGFGVDIDFFPNIGDFDGDGKYDFCIQRSNPASPANGQFVLLKSNGLGVEYINWGLSNDIIVPGDYDADGKADFCVSRTAGGNFNFYILERDGGGTGASPIVFGSSSLNDFRTPGDYDGDGKTDIAIWRPNADVTQNYFWVLQSSNGAVVITEWGMCPTNPTCDFPAANWSVH